MGSSARRRQDWLVLQQIVDIIDAPELVFSIGTTA
jgi:hypothetical protein